MGFFDDVNDVIEHTTGISVRRPGDNFTKNKLLDRLNPLKQFKADTESVDWWGKKIGLNKAGKAETTFPNGKPPPVPDMSDAEKALENARYLERRAKGRSSTLLSDEDTDEEANMGVARQRLMAS